MKRKQGFIAIKMMQMHQNIEEPCLNMIWFLESLQHWRIFDFQQFALLPVPVP